MLLVLVIGFAAVRLVLRVRRGKFGSRLLLKLAGIFALVGVIPGLLIYTVSYQFVSRSIESWFDVRVEGALDAGLNLGRGTLDALVGDLATKTRLAADRLGDARATSSRWRWCACASSCRRRTSRWSGRAASADRRPAAAVALAPDRPAPALLRRRAARRW